MEAVSSQLMSHILDRLPVLRAAYNAERPINRLPLEIKTEVFMAFLEEIPTNRKLSALILLCYVCRQWQDIILGCPVFHTRFELANPTLTHKFLGLSGILPLTISLVQPHARSENARSNAQALRPHLGRVQTLSIAAPSGELVEDVLGWLEELQSRVLTTLTLHKDGQDHIATLPLTFPRTHVQALSGLQSLHLYNIAIDDILLAPPVEYNLRRLILMFNDQNIPPCCSALISLVTQCPLLEVLVLSSRGRISCTEGDHDLAGRRLAHLKAITFAASGFKALVHLLDSVHGHTIDGLSLQASFPLNDRHVAELFVNPQDFAPYRLVAPRGLRTLHVSRTGTIIHIEGWYGVCAKASGEPAFKMDINLQQANDSGVDEGQLWTWPLADLSQVEVVHFLSHKAMPTSLVQWIGLLVDLPELKELVLDGTLPPITRTLLYALRAAARQAPSVPEPDLQAVQNPDCCPHLERVALLGGKRPRGFKRNVRKALVARYEARASTPEIEIMRCPAPQPGTRGRRSNSQPV
ncbi:hypothetical protein C8Q77DRAFT_563474 [Trametes polyzona]|nr:hypothetical protein C8Q77DRAFT_563474 [Trametes polyzona]